MIKKDNSMISPFFIMLEANKKKKPERVISVPANDNRRKSFADNVDNFEDIEEEPEDDQQDEPTGTDTTDDTGNADSEEYISGDDGDADFSDNIEEDDDVIGDAEETDNEETSDEGTEETSAEDSALETEPPDGADEAEPSDEEGGGEPSDEEGGGDELQTDDGGGDDFPEPDSMDGSDSGGEDSGTADTDTSTDTGDTGADNTIENRLKYSLYRSMKQMYRDVQSFGRRLESSEGFEIGFDEALKDAAVRLGNLEETMYQFMTTVYKDETYLICMDFYQNCKAVIMNIMKILEESKEKKK